ncbi:MAG: hypothetical protein M3O28_11175 [Actinomycetota bacterium]|nr:hypothetical protein [Actinomycetota bacterium]
MTIAVPLRQPVWQSIARHPVAVPSTIALAAAAAFVAVRPAVGDLWAALARQSATVHGVGLTYWFGWFGGGATPGGYSVLTPFLSAALGSVLLGALATAAIAPLCWRLVRGTAHPAAATWVAVITTGLSLWSGRIPYALGTAISILAFLAVRARRPVPAALWAAVTVLVSPVSGAFIAFALIGLAFKRSDYRRVSATTVLAAAASLGAVAMVFGSPGPEGFSATHAAVTAAALVSMLACRPQRQVRTVIMMSIAVCPLLVLIPNGLGSNFQRFVWVCLPVAVVATAVTRLPTAVLASGIAIFAGAHGTFTDLSVARSPMSSPAYYAPLAAELDTIGSLTNYRLEAVPDGTHTGSYALLTHAMLARGYETQADNALNAILMSKTTLNAVTFKVWLDNNAVGYVAIGKTALHPSPEFTLVSASTPAYLSKVWASADWTLYRVEHPSSIVAAPAVIVDAEQARLEISVPNAGALPVRVRWSKFLKVQAPANVDGATVRDDGSGWTTLTAPAPGLYILHG